jgi:hypothetical protein
MYLMIEQKHQQTSSACSFMISTSVTATWFRNVTYGSKAIFIKTHGSQESAVCISTGYGLDGRGVGVQLLAGAERSLHIDWLWAGWPRCRRSTPGRGKTFLLSTSTRPALRSTQPPIQWVPEPLSPRVKRQGRVDDQSPTSADVKNTWIYTSTPPYVFIL